MKEISPYKITSLVLLYRENLSRISLNARLFLLGTFFMGMGFSGFLLLFNLYLKAINLTEGRIGNIIATATLGTLIMALPSSIIIRRLPIKYILITTTLLAVAARFIQISTFNYSWLLLGGLTAGLFTVFSQVAAAPFFMRNSTPRERPYLFSMNFAASLVAGIFGSLLGGFLPDLIQRSGMPGDLTYRYTLYILGGLVLVALVPFFMIKDTPLQEPAAGMKFHSGKIIIKLFLPNLVTGIGAGLSIPFINLYFKNIFHAETGLIGIFYCGQQILMIAGLLIAPVLAERAGKIRTIVFSQLFSIPFLIIMGITNNLGFAVVAFLIRAAMMNMAQPLFTNFAMERVEHDEQPFTNALLVIAFTAGWGVSAGVGGLLIEHFSYSLPFIITSSLYLFSTIMIFFFFRGE